MSVESIKNYLKQKDLVEFIDLFHVKDLWSNGSRGEELESANFIGEDYNYKYYFETFDITPPNLWRVKR